MVVVLPKSCMVSSKSITLILATAHAEVTFGAFVMTNLIHLHQASFVIPVFALPQLVSITHSAILLWLSG